MTLPDPAEACPDYLPESPPSNSPAPSSVSFADWLHAHVLSTASIGISTVLAAIATTWMHPPPPAFDLHPSFDAMIFGAVVMFVGVCVVASAFTIPITVAMLPLVAWTIRRMLHPLILATVLGLVGMVAGPVGWYAMVFLKEGALEGYVIRDSIGLLVPVSGVAGAVFGEALRRRMGIVREKGRRPLVPPPLG
jgi:hypothetical protein